MTQKRWRCYFWKTAAGPAFAFRRIFDLRLAAALLHHGVDTWATRNLKDFAGCGFKRLVKPVDGKD